MNTNYSYVIADHIRSASMIIADGVLPSPKQRGYVLRRLIRRALLASMKLGIDIGNREYFAELVQAVVTIYTGVYDSVQENKDLIIDTLFLEAQKFLKARETGKKEWQKYFNTNGDRSSDALTTKAWDLYQSHGVPFEVSEEQVEVAGFVIDAQKLHSLIEEHQNKSASVSAGQFKSGLGGDTAQTRKLHTTTHILHAVLRQLFGSEVRQIGSAITDEKGRFDVTITQDITPEDHARIMTKVQDIITMGAPVTREEMTEQEARQLGAIGLFGEKYPERVTVYSIISPEGSVISREFCGGPHANNTGEIGTFSLAKIKSIGQGRKRFEFTVS